MPLLKKTLLGLLPLLAFGLCWEVCARTGVLNANLFPAPSTIFIGLGDLYKTPLQGRSILLGHLEATFVRLPLAALCGALAGLAAGVCMGLSTVCYRFCDPLITLVMPIPGIAMAPLFIVWMGFGDPTIITVGAIATFFPVAYNTCAGVRSADQQLVRAARIMGAGRRGVLLQVYLPWAAVYLFTGLKLGLARCWRTVIAVEFVAAADWGLGYMVWDAAEYLNAGVVYGGIILMAVLFVLLEKGLVHWLERRTIHKWGMVRA